MGFKPWQHGDRKRRWNIAIYAFSGLHMGRLREIMYEKYSKFKDVIMMSESQSQLQECVHEYECAWTSLAAAAVCDENCVVCVISTGHAIARQNERFGVQDVRDSLGEFVSLIEGSIGVQDILLDTVKDGDIILYDEAHEKAYALILRTPRKAAPGLTIGLKTMVNRSADAYFYVQGTPAYYVDTNGNVDMEKGRRFFR
jgi:hypothetical protein